MARDLKSKIIKTARALFMERGYNEVTMRDIADKLNISVGNLTYHFRRKEDLIETIILSKHEHYKKRVPPKTIAELDDFFRHVVIHKHENNYYFKNYNQLAAVCPKVYKIQLELMRDLYNIFCQAFENFKQSGLISDMETSTQDDIIKALMVICIHGIPPMFNESNDNQTLKCLWSVFSLCLSPKGKNLMPST